MSIFLALGFMILIYLAFVTLENRAIRRIVGGLLFVGLILSVLVMMRHF